MTLLNTQRVFSGRIVSLDVDTVRYPNGTVGELEMLRHPGASAVVPFLDDPHDDDPRVLLIRQFRHATNDYIWEIPPAGATPARPPKRRQSANSPKRLATPAAHCGSSLGSGPRPGSPTK